MSDNVKNYTDLQKMQPAAQMREVVKFEGVWTNKRKKKLPVIPGVRFYTRKIPLW